MFAIENDIPAPTAQRVRTRGDFSVTADQLQVGQSFFAPGRAAKGSYAALSGKKFPGKKFKIANVDASGDVPAGIRVWRTA